LRVLGEEKQLKYEMPTEPVGSDEWEALK